MKFMIGIYLFPKDGGVKVQKESWMWKDTWTH